MVSAISSMAPPPQPDLSMAVLQSQEKALDSSGKNLAVPKVQVPPPAQIAGSVPHIGSNVDKHA